MPNISLYLNTMGNLHEHFSLCWIPLFEKVNCTIGMSISSLFARNWRPGGGEGVLETRRKGRGYSRTGGGRGCSRPGGGKGVLESLRGVLETHCPIVSQSCNKNKNLNIHTYLFWVFLRIEWNRQIKTGNLSFLFIKNKPFSVLIIRKPYFFTPTPSLE